MLPSVRIMESSPKEPIKNLSIYTFWGTLAPLRAPTDRGVCTALPTSLTGAYFRVMYQKGRNKLSHVLLTYILWSGQFVIDNLGVEPASFEIQHASLIKRRPSSRLPNVFLLYTGRTLTNTSTDKYEQSANHLTLRRLMSYIYGAPILDVSRSHTTTQHSR